MSSLCQHCATPYADEVGVDGFCCAGCRQVYALIHSEGLSDYYRWQDRAAQPLKDRALSNLDVAALQCVQAQAESAEGVPEASLSVEGMSCMGCAWLIERLAGKQTGLIEVESSLSAHSVRLRWRKAEFDLTALAGELLRFGYRLEAKLLSPSKSSSLSPLALRCLLSAVFTGNALLLAAFTRFVGPASLVDLLSLTCLVFVLILGGGPFFLAVYRAGRIRRWHSDWIPALAIAGSLIYLSYRVVFSDMNLSMAAFLGALVVTVLSAVRAVFKRHQ